MDYISLLQPNIRNLIMSYIDFDNFNKFNDYLKLFSLFDWEKIIKFRYPYLNDVKWDDIPNNNCTNMLNNFITIPPEKNFKSLCIINIYLTLLNFEKNTLINNNINTYHLLYLLLLTNKEHINIGQYICSLFFNSDNVGNIVSELNDIKLSVPTIITKLIVKQKYPIFYGLYKTKLSNFGESEDYIWDDILFFMSNCLTYNNYITEHIYNFITTGTYSDFNLDVDDFIPPNNHNNNNRQFILLKYSYHITKFISAAILVLMYKCGNIFLDNNYELMTKFIDFVYPNYTDELFYYLDNNVIPYFILENKINMISY